MSSEKEEIIIKNKKNKSYSSLLEYLKNTLSKKCDDLIDLQKTTLFDLEKILKKL